MWVCISSHFFSSRDHDQGLKGPAFSSMLQESLFHSLLLERNSHFVFSEFPFLMKVAWLASHRQLPVGMFFLLLKYYYQIKSWSVYLAPVLFGWMSFIPSSRIVLRFWHFFTSKNLLMEDDHLEFAVQNQLKLQALTRYSAWIFDFFFFFLQSLSMSRGKKML